jgi:hypothetical protein
MTKGHVLVRSPIRLVPFLMKTIDRQVSYNLLRGGGTGVGKGVGGGGGGGWGWGLAANNTRVCIRK